MIKFAITIGAAAMLAGLLTVLPGMAPIVEAGTPALEAAAPKLEVPAPAAEQDRLPVAAPVACSQRAWPYYDQACLVDFDARFKGEPRKGKVRIVTTDRLQ
jgi:hypothetical protein